MVLVPASALVVSAMQKAEYQASARVLLRQSSVPDELLGAQLPASSNLPDRALRTHAELAHAPVVARRVVAAAPAAGESVQSFLGRSSVTALPDADVLVFNVRDADPRLAQRLANEYARQYTRYRQQFDRGPIERALADLDASAGSGPRSSVTRRTLELRAQQAINIAGASVVERASAARKIRPETARNGAFGLLLGTLFGVGLAFLWQALDTRLRSAAEIGDGLDLPLLARVPANRRLFAPDSAPVMLREPQSREAEAFRFLRTNLEFVNEHGARTIMVTSAHLHEGKSAVAANLAVALAYAGGRVTLVDLDLRRPSLARAFQLPGAGLTDVALGSATLDEAVATIPLHEPSTNGRQNGGRTSRGALRVLTSGHPPPDPAEFHETLALESILAKVRAISDLVVIDSSPLLGFGDAVSLSAKVDALLLVTRSSVLRRPVLVELRAVLDSCPAQKLGFVLTEAQLDRRLRDDSHDEGGSSTRTRDPVTSGA